MNRRMFTELDHTAKSYATMSAAVRAADKVSFKDEKGQPLALRYLVIPVDDCTRLALVFLLDEKQFYLARAITDMGHRVTT